MELDQDDLKRGLKFIVGTWQVDFLVNAWSNDLAHIPATEFKSEDGTDFTAINFEFFEDHSMIMKDTSKGKEIKGNWEQTGWSEFHYTLNDFLDIPDSQFKKNAETLSMQDGNLVFSIGFLAVSMKKTAEGTITKEPDIADMEMSAEDAALMGIVGEYVVAQTFGVVDDKPGLYDIDVIKAALEKKAAAGEIDEHDMQQTLRMCDMKVEFTESHKINTWMKLPEGVTEDQIKKALEAGEIKDYDGERFCPEQKEWKAINGKYYYDTGEHREIGGEVLSSWDELKFDENGLLDYVSGMMKLKKL